MVAAILIGRFLGAGVMALEEANAARVALGLEAKEIPLAGSRLLGGVAEEATKPPLVFPVSSTAIRLIAFTEPDTIVVEFNRGGTYTYDGDLALFMAFASAPSKGQFFNEHFRK